MILYTYIGVKNTCRGEYFCVDKDHRKSKIGEKLFLHQLNVCQDHNFIVNADCRMMKYYQRQGLNLGGYRSEYLGK